MNMSHLEASAYDALIAADLIPPEPANQHRKGRRWCAQIAIGINPKIDKAKRKALYERIRQEVTEKFTKVLRDLTDTFIEPVT